MAGVVDALALKFRNLGMDREEELQTLLLLVKVKGHVRRGEDIIKQGNSPSYSTVLLKGLACRYKLTENGRRRIFTFQYPGDFCDFDRYILPGQDYAVAALTDCSIGVLLHEDIERVIALYPGLGLALWRSTMVEASIFQERLVNVSSRPALPRIAHLLCELMVRLDAIGIDGTLIPMTQIDLADATSLSPVHMNRTIQDLRKRGTLSNNTRAIEVAHRNQLMDIGEFDGRYLNIPQLWSPSTHPLRVVV